MLGNGANGGGINASAFGAGAVASGSGATAFGRSANAIFTNSSAFGNGSTATGPNQLRLGIASQTASVPGALQVGGVTNGAGDAPTTLHLIKVTGVTSAPTSVPVNGGQLAFAEDSGFLYYYDTVVPAGWRVLGVSNAPTAESFNAVAPGVFNPNNAFCHELRYYFWRRNSHWYLANGTIIGQIKNIVSSSSFTNVYTLAVAAPGVLAPTGIFNFITYSAGGGEESSLIWMDLFGLL